MQALFVIAATVKATEILGKYRFVVVHRITEMKQRWKYNKPVFHGCPSPCLDIGRGFCRDISCVRHSYILNTDTQLLNSFVAP